MPDFSFDIKFLPINDLKPHPDNYNDHPDFEIDEIVASIEDHGVYKNVTVSRDMFILTGHGVVIAAKRLGMDKLPCKVIDQDHDDPDAILLLVGDNEIARIAHKDDAAVVGILQGIADQTTLTGTGFDAMRLQALAFVAADMPEPFDADSHWVGMPEFEDDDVVRVDVLFDSHHDMAAFVEKHGFNVRKVQSMNTTRWPPVGDMDPSAIIFTDGE